MKAPEPGTGAGARGGGDRKGMRKIVFTGGGTAGHVMPNVALFRQLREEGWAIHYIGSRNGIERDIVTGLAGFGEIPYYGISTGKLRRYFHPDNFRDPFRVLKGIWESVRLIRRIGPDLVFSKGGFVSVPVVVAGRLNGVPVIVHESDLTPGLANRIAMPFATRICATFPETMRHLPERKAVLTGSPIREELFAGDADAGRRMCGFRRDKPVLIVMGGSLGSRAINRAVRDSLDELLKRVQIVHICGKGNADPALEGRPGYRQFEFAGKELADLLAMADAAVSRAGANAIFELLALEKPMLLIPLSRQASRGDQILNAASFEKRGFCLTLQEEHLTPERLVRRVHELLDKREDIRRRMREAGGKTGNDAILALIRDLAAGRGAARR